MVSMCIVGACPIKSVTYANPIALLFMCFAAEKIIEDSISATEISFFLNQLKKFDSKAKELTHAEFVSIISAIPLFAKNH
jgi:hypothetical protein